MTAERGRSELAIREIRRRDVTPLVAVATEAFATEMAMMGADVRRMARQMRLLALVYPVQKQLPRPFMFALAGLVDSNPVAVVIAEPRTGSWYIQTVMVGANHRRRGYARALVEETCARAARAGAPRALLHMREDNVAAYRLYSSLGFKAFERVYALSLDPRAPVEAPPLPEGYTLLPRRRYDPRKLAVQDACREPGATEIYGPSQMPRLLERATGILFRPTDAVRRAVVSGGEWVGAYQYVQGSPAQSVSVAIEIQPDHRGRGLERALLAQAVNRAVTRGAKSVVTSVGASNTPLREACEELGFATRFVGVGMARSLP
jgi:ribosomal protein S18 acetylase RimI-like enzyme